MGVSLHMCVWTICMLGACWGRKRSLDLWNWSCRWLWDTIWVLGIVSMSSGVSTSALDCWATSTRTWPILTTKVPVSGGTMCHSVHVEVRKQLYGVNSFYSFFSSTFMWVLEIDSGYKACMVNTFTHRIITLSSMCLFMRYDMMFCM